MSVQLLKNLAREVRQIRDIEIWHSDLLPLINTGTKIPSSALNAYTAQFQQLDKE